jgi:hypothetical protein
MGNYWKIAFVLAVACGAWGTAVYAETLLSRRSPSAEDRAVEFLKSLPREWSGTSDHDCKTYEDKNIDRLSRSFAVSAARFLKAFVEVHGAVTITSAHRSGTPYGNVAAALPFPHSLEMLALMRLGQKRSREEALSRPGRCSRSAWR